MGKEYEDKMLTRMNALISIMLKSQMTDSSVIDKVRILKKSGLDYKEIAEIIGTSPNSVSVMFAKLNKENKNE